MKKFLLVSLLIFVLVFAGCQTQTANNAPQDTGNGANTTEEVAQASGASEGTEADRIKIGVSIWGTSDPLGGAVSKMIDYAAEALDCDVEYVATNLDTDAVVSSIENLCASGADAIIVCNSSDGQMPKLIRTCDENGVYLAQYFRTISDEEVIKLADDSKYFLGRTFEDEYDTGYNLGQIMVEKGCKNVAIISYNHGDLTAETRYKGYIDAFSESGVTILAEQWEILTAEEAANAVNSFLASYPEIDGIAVVGGGGEPLTGTISAIENNGKTGDIVVVSTDFTATLGEDLATGKVSAMSGGHWTDPFFSFMLAYNAVCNAYDPADFPLEIHHPMMYVASSEDYDNFNKWFEGNVPPFTTEEIQNLAITYNPETTFEDLQKAAENLSIEDVMTRHEGMLD